MVYLSLSICAWRACFLCGRAGWVPGQPSRQHHGLSGSQQAAREDQPSDLGIASALAPLASVGLARLYLDSWHVNEHVVAEIAVAFPCLERLDFGSCYITPEAWPSLHSLHCLTEFRFHGRTFERSEGAVEGLKLFLSCLQRELTLGIFVAGSQEELLKELRLHLVSVALLREGEGGAGPLVTFLN